MRAGGEATIRDVSHLRDAVPDWLTVYAFLGVADMALTLVAFRIGIAEANPFLAFYVDLGLFEFMKLSLTLLILCIAYKFRRNPVVENVMAVANTVMATLVVYHFASLSVLVI